MNIMNRYTIKTLYKNKLRTVVTIIGIILSTAMFTGVTSIVTSLQQYLVDLEMEDNGAWEGRINGLSNQEAKRILSDDGIKSGTIVGTVGYSKLENSLNPSKPYLCIQSLEKNTKDLVSVRLSQGRMPANDKEMVIPSHLETDGGISYEIGDTITLSVGKRTVNGNTGTQQMEYDNAKGVEKIQDTVKKQYKIVGICERPSIENYSAPGYTAFTKGEKNVTGVDIYFNLQNSRSIAKQMKGFVKQYSEKNWKKMQSDVDYAIHYALLQYMGTGDGNNYRQVLNTMAGALIFIIVLASVTLIYNAFSISVSERTKQFGLLKSIGATKKQIRHSVFFEGLSLCVIGIPLGILSGLLGIGITLHFVDGILTPLMNSVSKVNLTLNVNPTAIVLSAVIAVVTVLLSAWIPARKAVKQTAIDSLRESHDIYIRSRKVRSPKWVLKLFGFEGMLANKNFKRNRKKYRLTVFSLAISVVLFIGSASFNNYMNKTADLAIEDITADVSFSVTREEMNHKDLNMSYHRMKSLEKVDQAAYSESANHIYMILNKEDLDQGYYQFNVSRQNSNEYTGFHAKNAGKKVIVPVKLAFVDDDSYREYLQKNHLEVSRFMNTKTLSPLIWDKNTVETKDNSRKQFHILRKGFTPKELYCIRSVNGYLYYDDYQNIDLEKMEFPFEKAEEENTEEEDASITMLSEKKVVKKVKLSSGKVVSKTTYKAPLGLGRIEDYGESVTMTLPYSAKKAAFSQVSFSDVYEFNFSAKDYNGAYSTISNYLRNDSGFAKNVVTTMYSQRMNRDSTKASFLIVQIFTYGFIVLISLIVIANIFNTISTNIMLRRKEFAMLKSVGMTRKGFDRMMNYECLLYGIKGLLIGLPLGVGINYLMYHSLNDAVQIGFQIPLGSVITVIMVVFLVVFVSMMYSMHKIKKDNPIEALKNDNI